MLQRQAEANREAQKNKTLQQKEQTIREKYDNYKIDEDQLGNEVSSSTYSPLTAESIQVNSYQES